MDEIKKVAEGIFYKIGFGILIAMIAFFCSQYVLKLNEIQKDLAKLQIEVGKIQIQIIDREEIKEIIKEYHETHPCLKGSKL